MAENSKRSCEVGCSEKVMSIEGWVEVSEVPGLFVLEPELKESLRKAEESLTDEEVERVFEEVFKDTSRLRLARKSRQVRKRQLAGGVARD